MRPLQPLLDFAELPNSNARGWMNRFMVTISKEEAGEIRLRFPSRGHVIRLEKRDSKRHHYLVSEEPAVLKFLSQYRQTPTQAPPAPQF